MFSIWKRNIPGWMKRRAMVGWYNYIGRLNTNSEVLFLNHGFADPAVKSPELPEHLEPHRYFIQLYHHIVSQTDISGKDVLEVSSGLGGGVRWMASCHDPRSITGLDIAEDAVRACRARNADSRVRFETGDAQAMPFATGSFDAVVNVESSLNYPDFNAFLKEVDRVLRPGGYFLFADYRRAGHYARMTDGLEQMGYRTVFSKDISRAIVLGLDHTNSIKREAVLRHVPRLLRKTALRFAGLDRNFDDEKRSFSSGEKRYLATVLQGPM